MKHIQSHFDPRMPYCGQSGLPPEEPLLPHDAVPADPEGTCPWCLDVQRACLMHAERGRQRLKMEAESRQRALARMGGGSETGAV
jgi:hypothetical protein